MTTNCADGVYNIKYTDKAKNPIIVNKKTLIQNVLDIILLGKSRREYGEAFDDNILHMLENFSAPENPDSPGTPDYSGIYSNLLENPANGQFWYNSTKKHLCFFNGVNWISLGDATDVAGNSGIISDGEQLPNPVSATTGYVFPYNECVWVVSPTNLPDEVDYMVCYTDDTANVTSQYRAANSGTISSGEAFYKIVGIKGNINHGSNNPVIPIIPSPTPIPPVSQSPLPTPGVTPSITQSAAATPTPTVTMTVTPSPTPVPSRTPTASVAPLAAVLYISPSKGYPQGVNTAIVTPCYTTSTSDTACFANMSVILQNISGGTAPYSVDMTNVIFNSNVINTATGTTVGSTTSQTYSGASGASTNPVRTGCTTTSTLQVKSIISLTAGNVLHCNNGQWTFSINAGSYVLITDSMGRTLKLYTPSGLSGNVYGTAYTTPQGVYSDSYYSTGSCSSGGGSGGDKSGGGGLGSVVIRPE